MKPRWQKSRIPKRSKPKHDLSPKKREGDKDPAQADLDKERWSDHDAE